MEKLAVGIGRIKPKIEPPTPSQDVCIACDGIGYVVKRDKNNRQFTRPCPICDAVNVAREKRQFEVAEIPTLPKKIETNPIAVEYVEKFRALTPKDNWIMFTGRTGSGKTTQASWIATNIIKKYKELVRFYSAIEITRRLAMVRRGEERDKILDEIQETPFIVLDDLLKTFPSKNSFQYADYFQATLEILWGRYDSGKPTAITTQRDFRTIAEFDTAIAGRIVECCGGRIVKYGENSQNRRLENENAENRLR